MALWIAQLIFCFCIAYADHPPTVNTPLGKIQGTISTSYKGTIYSQFLGIPYAKPPVGDLRFREPQPIEKWTGTWIANVTQICTQVTHTADPEGGYFSGEEDCLYLSIFVPKKQPSESDLLDVIIHIHGGAFNFGYGDMYAGPKYLMDKNVIFVTINYRVGPLGFLSTEDDVVPGNDGMKDQSMALKWIKDNIKYFGGNPDSITITGLSAGGSSVHFHYLSPLSKGLFNKGISMSGTVLSPWAMQEAALEKTRKLALSVGCPQKCTKELVDCLRQRPAKQIVENVNMFRPWLFNPFSPFGLVVEKGGKRPFLSEHPYKLLSKGQVQNLPWITSVTSHEGLYPAAEFFAKDSHLETLEERWDELAAAVLDYNHTLPLEAHSSVAKMVKEHYLEDNSITKETFNDLVQMIGDRFFIVPAEKGAKLQAKVNKSPVYYYYFSYSSEKNPSLADYFAPMDPKQGVCHGDDMMFILSVPHDSEVKMSKSDEEIQQTLLNIWSSFAKTGIPEVENVQWEPVLGDTKKPLKYLHIKSPKEIFMAETEDMGKCSFWDTIPFEEDENIFRNQKDEL